MHIFNLENSFSTGLALSLCAVLLVACSPKAASESTQINGPEVEKPAPETTTEPSTLALIENSELDPMCMLTLLETNVLDTPVSQEGCLEGYTTEGYTRDADGAGSYQVIYRENENNISQHVGYRPIGKTGDNLLIEMYWDWGGQTHFNALKQVSETDGQIRFAKNYPLGDRCMGGLQNPRTDAGHVLYARNLTHFGFLNILAKDKSSQTISYEGIGNSTQDCLATSEYKDDILQGVRLTQTYMNNLKQNRVSEEDNFIQYCFDDLLLLNVSHGENYFSKEDLPIFIREIQHTCLGAQEGAPENGSETITFPASIFPDISRATNTILEHCANGVASACDQTRKIDEISDHQFSTIHRRCNAGEKQFCTLLDNLIAAEVRDQ